jgi:hypothetical protein
MQLHLWLLYVYIPFIKKGVYFVLFVSVPHCTLGAVGKPWTKWCAEFQFQTNKAKIVEFIIIYLFNQFKVTKMVFSTNQCLFIILTPCLPFPIPNLNP